MREDFTTLAAAMLASATPADTVVLAVVGPDGNLIMQTQCDRPRDLARIAASLAGETVERLDMQAAARSGHALAMLWIACQDAQREISTALRDD